MWDRNCLQRGFLCDGAFLSYQHLFWSAVIEFRLIYLMEKKKGDVLRVSKGEVGCKVTDEMLMLKDRKQRDELLEKECESKLK